MNDEKKNNCTNHVMLRFHRNFKIDDKLENICLNFVDCWFFGFWFHSLLLSHSNSDVFFNFSFFLYSIQSLGLLSSVIKRLNSIWIILGSEHLKWVRCSNMCNEQNDCDTIGYCQHRFKRWTILLAFVIQMFVTTLRELSQINKILCVQAKVEKFQWFWHPHNA